MASLTQIEGKYEILEKLHDGGMGSIYRVQHRLLQEQRVVKTMRRQLAEDAQFRNRFLQEAQLAASLKHPNIAQIHDFTVDESGTGLIVMEFIDGVSLKEILATLGPPDLALTLEVARQALRALGFLHRKGYIHRDISPDNVMLAEDVDGRPEAKLIDLGIAKKLGGADGLTTTGHFLGKLRYSSPEHFGTKGAAGADERSDVYSFGLVLYEILTGQPAVLGNDLSSLSAGHVLRPPQSFEETDPGGRVPEDLRLLVLRALAKDPTLRFADAEDFARAIAEVQADHPLPPEFSVASLLEPMREKKRIQRGDTLEAPVGGSTQVRFDRQFGIETTPTGRRGLEGSGSRSRKPPVRLLLHEEPSSDEDTGVYHTVSGDVVPAAATVAMPLSEAGRTRRIPDIAAHLASSRATQDPGATRVALDPSVEAQPTPPSAGSSGNLETRIEEASERVEAPTSATAFVPPPPSVPDVPEPSAGSPAAAAEPEGDSRRPAAEVAPPEPAEPEARPAAGPPPAGQPADVPGRRGKLALVGGLLGAVVLAAVLFLVFGGKEPEVAEKAPPPPAPPVEPLPPPPPAPVVEETPELHPELVAARDCLSEGDAECARLAIETLADESVYLTAEEEKELAAVTAEVEAIEAVLAESTADLEALGQKLVESLASGPVTQLRDSVDALKKLRSNDREAFDGLGEEVLDAFAEGDKIIIEYRRMWRFKNKDSHLEVIPQADRLIEVYPPYVESAREHREAAAAAVEAEASELESGDDLLGAASLLRVLQEVAPGRSGLAEKIAGLEKEQARLEGVEGTLDRAEQHLRNRKPEEGRAVLARLSLAAGSPFAERKERLARQLQALYVSMDESPPEISLADGQELEYRRRETIRIELRVVDAYRVESVVAHARPDDRDATFQPVSVTRGEGSKYIVEIGPEIHDNDRTVYYFVEATDPSGHTTSFGSETMPKSVRRKGF